MARKRSPFASLLKAQREFEKAYIKTIEKICDYASARNFVGLGEIVNDSIGIRRQGNVPGLSMLIDVIRWHGLVSKTNDDLGKRIFANYVLDQIGKIKYYLYNPDVLSRATRTQHIPNQLHRLDTAIARTASDIGCEKKAYMTGTLSPDTVWRAYWSNNPTYDHSMYISVVSHALRYLRDPSLLISKHGFGETPFFILSKHYSGRTIIDIYVFETTIKEFQFPMTQYVAHHRNGILDVILLEDVFVNDYIFDAFEEDYSIGKGLLPMELDHRCFLTIYGTEPILEEVLVLNEMSKSKFKRCEISYVKSLIKFAEAALPSGCAYCSALGNERLASEIQQLRERIVSAYDVEI